MKKVIKTLAMIVAITDREDGIVEISELAKTRCKRIVALCEIGYCSIRKTVALGDVGLKEIWIISPTDLGRRRVKIKHPTIKDIIANFSFS
ncbi:MAG: hypothetical protein WCX30_03110 [Candidatus Paceibacterota bacterium]